MTTPEPTPTITSIVPVTGEPGRRRVRVGNRRVATLTAHEVADLELQVGVPWSQALAERVRLTVEKRAARTRALRMLGRRALTHGEIAERLAKAFSPDLAHEIADELVEQGWIDEPQIAMQAARDLSQRTIVREAIVEKLRARRLDEAVAEDAASAALADVDHVALASQFIRKKLAGRRGKPAERDIRRTLAALSRKGFEFDDVAAAFRSHGVDIRELAGGTE